MEYKHSRNQVYLINYHLIWCPKRRKPVLVGKVKQRLEQIIKEIAKEKGVEILNLSIQPNHSITSFPPILQLLSINWLKLLRVEVLTTYVENYLKLLKLPTLWTHSYFVSTAGNVSSQTIQKYIEEQSKS
ncbi:MAG: IS200/IS605 family transposase [Candidatus Humimicrobiaceae bacterium]